MLKSIFDGVIKSENSFTELFTNFLKYKPFRDAFLLKIGVHKSSATFDHSHFNTQNSLGDYGIPDLYILNEECEILIEIKVTNIPRTNNQPNGYFNFLKLSDKSEKHLVFITPKYYYDLDTYNNEVSLLKQDCNNVCTSILFWEDISEIIFQNELNKISPLFSEYNLFIDNWFNLTKITFDTNLINMLYSKDFPLAILNLQNIIYKVFQNFEKKKYSLLWYTHKEFDEYGFYFNLNDSKENEKLFFGMWFDYWKETGNPICYSLSTGNSVRQNTFEKNCTQNNMPLVRVFDRNKVTYFESSFLQSDNVVNSICNRLEKLIENMNLKSISE